MKIHVIGGKTPKQNVEGRDREKLNKEIREKTSIER